MEPIHEELISLNPRLKIFSPEKLSSLLATIKACGWKWNANRKYFELPEYKTAIRTEGLDIFDADSFREHHNDIIQGAMLHLKDNKKSKYTFLAKNATYVIYFSILSSLLVNAILMILYLRSLWLIILSLISIYLFPKAVLGFILISGSNNSLISLNLSKAIRLFFSPTVQHYNNWRTLNGEGIENSLINEILWLIASLAPFILYWQGYR